MSPPSKRSRLPLVRPYLITGGRTHPTRDAFDLTTLVRATHGGTTQGLNPEEHRTVQLCSGGALSVAEVAAHLELPPSVTRVVVANLVDSGHLTVRVPARQQGPDHELLQEVLDGLQAL